MNVWLLPLFHRYKVPFYLCHNFCLFLCLLVVTLVFFRFYDKDRKTKRWHTDFFLKKLVFLNSLSYHYSTSLKKKLCFHHLPLSINDVWMHSSSFLEVYVLIVAFHKLFISLITNKNFFFLCYLLLFLDGLKYVITYANATTEIFDLIYGTRSNEPVSENSVSPCNLINF